LRLIRKILQLMEEKRIAEDQVMGSLSTYRARWDDVKAGRAIPWHPALCNGYRETAELLGSVPSELSALAMRDREEGPENPFTRKDLSATLEIER